jgi:hypothetical protein
VVPGGIDQNPAQKGTKITCQRDGGKEWEEERHWWFNQEWPMVPAGKTWKQKRIEQEEKGSDSGSDAESGGDQGAGNAEINMVFHLPMEFTLPETELA